MTPNHNGTCERIEGRLSDCVDRLLDADERSAFEQHVAGCARCAPLVRSVGGLVAAMHHLEPLEAPAGLYNKILDRTLGPRAEKKRWRAWLAWPRLVTQPRFAYGAVSVLFTVIVLSQALGVQWRKPTLADLNPVNIYRAVDRRAHMIYARGAKFVTDLRVVYEIQSRLHPEAEPQPPPEQKPGPGQSTGPRPRSPRQFSQGHESSLRFSLVSCILIAEPGRSY